jgi:hypothetical protein
MNILLERCGFGPLSKFTNFTDKVESMRCSAAPVGDQRRRLHQPRHPVGLSRLAIAALLAILMIQVSLALAASASSRLPESVTVGDSLRYVVNHVQHQTVPEFGVSVPILVSLLLVAIVIIWGRRKA